MPPTGPFDKAEFDRVTTERQEAFARASGRSRAPDPGSYTVQLTDVQQGTAVDRTTHQDYIYVRPHYAVHDPDGELHGFAWSDGFDTRGARPGKPRGPIDMFKGFLCDVLGYDPDHLQTAIEELIALEGKFLAVEVIESESNGKIWRNTYVRAVLADGAVTVEPTRAAPGTAGPTADATAATESAPAAGGQSVWKPALGERVWMPDSDPKNPEGGFAGTVKSVSARKKTAVVAFDGYDDEEPEACNFNSLEPLADGS